MVTNHLPARSATKALRSICTIPPKPSVYLKGINKVQCEVSSQLGENFHFSVSIFRATH